MLGLGVWFRGRDLFGRFPDHLLAGLGGTPSPLSKYLETDTDDQETSAGPYNNSTISTGYHP
jgi:hypothetical protein